MLCTHAVDGEVMAVFNCCTRLGAVSLQMLVLISARVFKGVRSNSLLQTLMTFFGVVLGAALLTGLWSRVPTQQGMRKRLLLLLWMQ